MLRRPPGIRGAWVGLEVCLGKWWVVKCLWKGKFAVDGEAHSIHVGEAAPQVVPDEGRGMLLWGCAWVYWR